MAQFELNTYGKDDEILKSFTTDRVRWGVFMQALELQETLDTKTSAEQFAAINTFIKKIFPELTDADLENADTDDVLNTFQQLIKKAQKIGGRGNSKNAAGAV